MSNTNLNTRAKAVPFLSTSFVDRGIPNDDRFSSSILLSDPTITSNLTKAVPMCTPEAGDLIESYLFLQMLAPSDKGLNVKIGIGRFVESGGEATVVPETSYSTSYVDREHRRLTGRNDAFTTTANSLLTIEVNLKPGIPGGNDENYLSDAFVLIVNFGSLPDPDNDYELRKFFVSGSAQIGVAR